MKEWKIESPMAIIGLVAGVLCTSPRSQSNPPLPGTPRIHVSSAIDGTPVREALVIVQENDADPITSAISDGNGWAWLEGIEVGAAATAFTIRIEHLNYLPFKRNIAISSGENAQFRPLVPSDVGYETPLVDATKGGRFDIKGLGTLRVAAHAMTQDAKLRLIPIPDIAWSDINEDGGILRYQLWLTAEDQAGNPLHAAVPANPGSITLEIDLPTNEIVPTDATLETWTTHCVGEFQYDLTSASQSDGNSVIMAIGAGHNLLYHTYAVPDAGAAGCYWGPWKTRIVKIGERVIGQGPSVPVICGVITTGGHFKIEAQETVETNLEIFEEDYRKYGIEGGSKWVTKVNVESGFKSSIKKGTNTIVTAAKEQLLQFETGDTLSGRPAGSQPSGYDCINATKRHGLLFYKYRLEAYRYHTCGKPPFVHALAEFEVYRGITTWYEGPNGMPLPQWDASCGANCTPVGDIPSGMPLKPQ